jgi:dTDP-glucose 4,6-dehydratase
LDCEAEKTSPRLNMSTLLVTGGAGFIGSNFVRLAVRRGFRVINLDKLTYAGNLDNLNELLKNDAYTFVRGDITDKSLVSRILTQYQPDGLINFAAESHVDRSIDDPRQFLNTNVLGTFELLQASLDYWKCLESEAARSFRFLQVSTDEVFGSLGSTGAFTENTPYAPNSPYAASKASADHFVRAVHKTYGLPTLITNCSNNYGPYQFPEKLIPLVVLNALEGKPLPVYGDGEHVRDWLYVEDHCQAILEVLSRAAPGSTFNIGGRVPQRNIDVVRSICALLDEFVPSERKYSDLITFVKDRPGHDRRYAIDPGMIERELGWCAEHSFDVGIRKTVEWYVDNSEWCRRVSSGDYRRERLGLGQ